MDNMHNAELYGRVRPHKRGWRGDGRANATRACACGHAARAAAGQLRAIGSCPTLHADAARTAQVLRCNYAQPQKIRGGDAGFSTQPVWADADDYQERLEEAGMGVVADE